MELKTAGYVPWKILRYGTRQMSQISRIHEKRIIKNYLDTSSGELVTMCIKVKVVVSVRLVYSYKQKLNLKFGKLLLISLSCITGHCHDLKTNTCHPQSLNYNTSELITDYKTDQDGCFNPEEMKATIMYQHYLKVEQILELLKIFIMF